MSKRIFNLIHSYLEGLFLCLVSIGLQCFQSPAVVLLTHFIRQHPNHENKAHFVRNLK